jgi:hypothetical protein
VVTGLSNEECALREKNLMRSDTGNTSGETEDEPFDCAFLNNEFTRGDDLIQEQLFSLGNKHRLLSDVYDFIT